MFIIKNKREVVKKKGWEIQKEKNGPGMGRKGELSHFYDRRKPAWLGAFPLFWGLLFKSGNYPEILCLFRVIFSGFLCPQGIHLLLEPES